MISKFFIRRPIVAMVIAILTVIGGFVCMLSLPTAQFPNIVPPKSSSRRPILAPTPRLSNKPSPRPSSNR